MCRNVGLSATAVFSRDVRGRDSSRTYGNMEMDRLRPGGDVRVFVVPESIQALDLCFHKIVDGELIGRHLFIVHGRNVGKSMSGRRGLFNYSVRAAKGLESDSIIVNMPFSAAARHSGEVIDLDGALEYYTSVSRARDKVLLIIDSLSWSRLKLAQGAWHHAEVASWETHGIKWLRDAVMGATVVLSSTDLVTARIKQLEDAVNSTSLGSEDVVETVVEVLRDLAHYPSDDLVADLSRAGHVLLGVNSDAMQRLRQWYSDARASLTELEQIPFLLFFGELAMAKWQAQKLPSGGGKGWETEWLQEVCRESPIQNERATADVEPIAWTEDHAEQSLLLDLLGKLRQKFIHRQMADLSISQSYVKISEGDSDKLYALSAADASAYRRLAERMVKLRENVADIERFLIADAMREFADRQKEFSVRIDRIESQLRAYE